MLGLFSCEQLKEFVDVAHDTFKHEQFIGQLKLGAQGDVQGCVVFSVGQDWDLEFLVHIVDLRLIYIGNTFACFVKDEADQVGDVRAFNFVRHFFLLPFRFLAQADNLVEESLTTGKDAEAELQMVLWVGPFQFEVHEVLEFAEDHKVEDCETVFGFKRRVFILQVHRVVHIEDLELAIFSVQVEELFVAHPGFVLAHAPHQAIDRVLLRNEVVFEKDVRLSVAFLEVVNFAEADDLETLGVVEDAVDVLFVDNADVLVIKQ